MEDQVRELLQSPSEEAVRDFFGQVCFLQVENGQASSAHRAK